MDETRRDRGTTGSSPPAVAIIVPDEPSPSSNKPGTGPVGRQESFRTGEWQPPQTVDEYSIIRALGAGAMGQVYLAHDCVLDRAVAIKFVASGRQADPEAHARLLIEARAIARVQHPNVVAIHRVGAVDGRPYLVSEFIHGQSLDTMKRPMPWQKVLSLALGLARGLAAAHRQGVLHRDIKLANAILSNADGEAKLLDFGLAKLSEAVQPPLVASGAGMADPVASPIDLAASARSISLLFSTTSSKTCDGAVLGSPRYMAPELWLGEPASCRSDVYALGVMLFYLCAGRPPHVAAHLADLKERAIGGNSPSLASVVPNVDPGFAAVVDLCLKRDPALRFQSGDELREALDRVMPEANAAIVPEGNPYRGLSAFQAEHRAVFFGRDSETRAIVERLRAESFVLVAGDSGVGKSSICHAGVVPKVAGGALGGGRTWSTLTLVPGRAPLHALCAVLSPALGRDPENLLLQITAEKDPFERTGATSIGNDLRIRQGIERGLLIFVDQFEELVTISDRGQAHLFSSVLSELITLAPGVRIVGTVRADFFARVASLPGLGSSLNRALHILQPLSSEGIREAIVGPARAKGVSFEPDALDFLEKSAKAEGSLPLLQFALAELWDKRDSTTLTISLAACVSNGGVEGALARHADAVIQSLLPDQRIEARRILTHLVTAGGTRTRRTEVELVQNRSEAKVALDTLVRGRLVATRETDEGTTFDLAHEALIRGWSTLNGWLSTDRELRAAKERLAVAAGEWKRLSHSTEVLWGEHQLSEWTNIGTSDLPERDAPFLRASRQAANKRRRARRVRNATIPIAIAVLAASIWGLAALQNRRAIDQRIENLVRAGNAKLEAPREAAARTAELRAQALKLFDAGNLSAAEEVWARVLSTRRSVEQDMGDASVLLEEAVMVDSSRRDVRSLLANVLYERALLAEQSGKTEQRNDLVRRFKSLDERVHERWSAPATISISSGPDGAFVTLQRYVEQESGRFELVKVRDLGPTPISQVELRPGSYLLVFSAAGRVAVRYPFIVERGEKLTIRVDLPLEGAIPPGYIYVPAGRFLYGTAADEGTRRWFQTVPLHQVETQGYIIGRTEVTFADWFEFLRESPPDVRKRLTPSASGKAGYDYLLDIRDLGAARWELTLHLGTNSYHAISNQSLRYTIVDVDGQRRTRARNAVQQWIRFPVVGVSATDAEAYARWLSRTGRVHEARLCTDYEWERAARGADDRNLPHGNELRLEDVNVRASYERGLGGPDEVGIHPASNSPFGVADMAGNAFEWTISATVQHQFVLRSGSYMQTDQTSMIPNRTVSGPTARDAALGLRICAPFPATQEKATPRSR